MRRSVLIFAIAFALAAQPSWTAPVRAAPEYFLPAPKGTTLLVFQGNNSAFNHVAASGSQHAWDFTDGTTEFPVVASRGGTVIGARSDSTNTKCRDISCWKDANYVLVDHGDGTSALYLHLATGSVKVTEGQKIGHGVELGRADSTGFSYGTHLHFMVEKTPTTRGGSGWWWTQSVPVTFADAGSADDGKRYISANELAVAATTIPAPSEGPTPKPTQRLGSTAEVIVDSLRVRSAPEISDTSIKLDPLLHAGDRMAILAGPLHASGYEWYLIMPLNRETNFQNWRYPWGWIAAASRDGEPWIASAKAACPSRPRTLGTLAALPNVVGMICFGGTPITFNAALVQGRCEFLFGSANKPLWFNGNSAVLEDGSECGFVLVIDPSVPLPAGGLQSLFGTTLQITGMFDHPAARDCVFTLVDEGTTVAGPEGAMYCRLTFVVTGIG